jgi:hypothetical protein
MAQTLFVLFVILIVASWIVRGARWQRRRRRGADGTGARLTPPTSFGAPGAGHQHHHHHHGAGGHHGSGGGHHGS